MLDFTGNDKKAKLIALHYASEMSDEFIIDMISHDKDVINSDEATRLSKFYWSMLDLSAKDEEEGNEVLGEVGQQYWMERLLNIVGGYLSKNGYDAQWQKVCDEA